MNASLLAQIDALRTTLNKSPKVDDAVREALTLLQNDIARALHDKSARQQLEELAVRFETEHPAAGTAIREVMNTLVKLGI